MDRHVWTRSGYASASLLKPPHDCWHVRRKLQSVALSTNDAAAGGVPGSTSSSNERRMASDAPIQKP